MQYTTKSNALPVQDKNLRETGLYIHIPFCERKCLYCDFTSYPVARQEVFVRYLDALYREMDCKASSVEGRVVATIYFGGGTPSLLGGELLRQALFAIRERYVVAPDAEITLEINPSSASSGASSGLLPSIREAGFNRVNMGVQSFSDGLLRTLGRIHDSKTAIKAFAALKEEGFDNAGIDLIFGIPGQGLDDWRQTLGTAIDLVPQHISAYSLIHEEGTPMTGLLEAGTLASAPDYLEESMYRLLVETTEGAGYRRYEVSNFALPGHECRHNLNYWNHGEYLGLGAGAHSFMDGRRWSNEDSLDRYMAAPDACSFFEDGPEDAAGSMKEFLMLGLRKVDGVALVEIKTRWGADAVSDVLRRGSRFIEEGFLKEDGNRLWIADKGFFVMNEVLGVFF